MDANMNRLGIAALAALSLPAFISGFMHAPAAAILQGVYAKHAGITLTAIGSVVLLTRVFDAITDPLIGLWSDRLHRSTGTRKPFVAVGLGIAVIGLWQLFTPSSEPTIYYFGGWFILTYLGWTLADIPLRAWSVELSTDYSERSRIQTWITTLTLIGTTMFFLLPYAATYLELTDTSEVDFDTLFYVAVALIVVTPLIVLFCLFVAPDSDSSSYAEGDSTGEGLKEIWLSVIGNRPFLYFTGMFLMIAVASGIGQGATFFYIDNYLGLGEQLPALLAMALPLMMLSIPVWGKLAAKFDRRKVWAIAIVISAIGNALLGIIQPGENTFLILVVVFAIIYFSFGSSMVIAPAMLGDVVDYGRAKFGKNRSGIYFSLYSLIQKMTAGGGVALGLVILGWFGFDATASQQTEQAEFGLIFSVSYFPAIALLLTAPLISRFPISIQVQRELAAKLKA